MAATPMVKVIYGKPLLPDLARVLACLNEKEIKFELEDMNKGMRMSQDILNLQISSHGRTPVLIDGLDELFGSRKICRHVVEKYRAYGYPYLLGKDPLSKVSIEQWIKSEEQRFDPPSSALVFYLAYNIEADIEKTTQSEKKLEKVLNLYEKRLGESDFLAANYFTIADLYHLPNTYYLQSSVEYGHLFKERKNVSRWWKSISERKSWKEVVKKFEEEGLQFYVPVTISETEKSLFSTHKNGIKFGPFGSSEIGSKIERVEPATKDSKETLEPTDKDKFSSTESKSGRTDEGKERDASKTITEADKERPKPDDKDKPFGSSEIGSKIERVEPATKDSKETLEPIDKDKFSSTEKSKSGRTDEGKERDASKTATEADKEKPKPDDKDKPSLGDTEKSGTTDETKEPYANKPEGDKETPKLDEKDKTSSDDNRKMGVTDKRKESDANKLASEENKEAQKLGDKDKASSSDQKNPVKIDDIKDREADKKDPEGEKIDENKESKTNDAGTEGKKDEFKFGDKDKYSSGNKKERDVTKENDNRGAIDSNNQVEKGSAPDDGKEKTSNNNKNPSSQDEKEKANL